MSTIEFSDYQKAFFKEVDRSKGNIGLNSVAGSGKTFTAVESLRFIPTIYSVQFCAFGTDIAAALRPKITRKNTTISTYNAFGWGIACRQAKQKLILEKDNKTIPTLQHGILQAKEEDSESWAKFTRCRGAVKRLVSLLKGECIFKEEDAYAKIDELIEHYQIQVPNDHDFNEVVAPTFGACIRNEIVYDYDDQIYQVLRQNMLVPAFDVVYNDEFQDCNEMQSRLMLASSRNGRFFGIGDPDQSIYGFRGATRGGFQKFITDFKAKEMFLSICYRCPKAAVRSAQRIVPRIEYAPWAREGVEDTISTDQFKLMVRPGDFVLCRTIAPLVKRCLENIRDGLPARVLGKNIGDDLEYLITKVCNSAFFTSITSFRDMLGEYVQKKMSAYTALHQEALAIDLYDKAETLTAFMEGCSMVTDILQRIRNVFTENKGLYIMYMSIHKSKGLECDNNVFILRRDLLPHPRAKNVEWMSLEELRLEYVAVTRTKGGLYWVIKERNEK